MSTVLIILALLLVPVAIGALVMAYQFHQVGREIDEDRG